MLHHGGALVSRRVPSLLVHCLWQFARDFVVHLSTINSRKPLLIPPCPSIRPLAPRVRFLVVVDNGSGALITDQLHTHYAT